MHEQQAFAQRHADMVGELHGRGASAAFLAIDDDEVRQDAGFQHGLGNAHEFPRVAQAELETHRLAARQLAQAGNELQQLDRRAEGTVRRRGDAVLAHAHTTGLGNLGADLVPRQDAAVARLGALAELDLDHLHLWRARLLGETLRVEAAVLGAAAEVATADFPDQVTAMFAVVRADAAFAGVMGKTAHARTAVERRDGVGTEGAEAHGRNVEDRGRVGQAALRPANGDTERCRVWRGHRQHGMADELEAGFVGIVERAEGFLGAFVLGAGVDQRALRAGERQLVVVALDQVLADFRADGLDQVADVAQDRVVAAHRMVALAQVVQADQAEQRGDQGYWPQPGMLEQQRQAGEGEQQAESEAGVAAG
ncbi:hypothetical protein D9M71_437790 [compost metagenome]